MTTNQHLNEVVVSKNQSKSKKIIEYDSETEGTDAIGAPISKKQPSNPSQVASSDSSTSTVILEEEPVPTNSKKRMTRSRSSLEVIRLQKNINSYCFNIY